MKVIGKSDFHGVPVDVVDKIDWTDNTVLVCGFKSNFKDDIKSYCSECGITVYYRPYNPVDVKKVCFDCLPKIEGGDKT